MLFAYAMSAIYTAVPLLVLFLNEFTYLFTLLTFLYLLSYFTLPCLTFLNTLTTKDVLIRPKLGFRYQGRVYTSVT